MRGPDAPPPVTGARAGAVALVAVVVAVAGWLLLDMLERSGRPAPPLPWTAAAGTLLLAAVVLGAGVPVRRYVAGRRERPLDPLFAARVFVLAKAAAYGGAALAGWYLAQALVLLPDLVGERRSRFVVGLVAVVAAVAVAVAGLVVQRWCRVPPPDDEDTPPRSP